MAEERWSVEIQRHSVGQGGRYESATQEMTVFLTLEQVGQVRSAILRALVDAGP